MRLTLHLHADSSRATDTLVSDLAGLEIENLKLDLAIAAEPRTFQAVARGLDWRAGEVRALPNTEARSFAPSRLDEVAGDDAPAIIVGAGVRLAPHLSRYAAAVSARDLGVDAAPLFALPRLRPGSPPFTPLEDGGDGVFAAIDPGAGLVVTPSQAAALLNPGPETSGCFLFPRTGLASGGRSPFEPTIEHNARDWRFRTHGESLAVYDQHLEITPEALRRAVPALADLDFAVDLTGDGPTPTAPYLLSARPCRAPIRTFGLDLTPLAANIVFATPGGVFSLGPTEAFEPMTAARRRALRHYLSRSFDLRGYVVSWSGQTPPPGVPKPRAHASIVDDHDLAHSLAAGQVSDGVAGLGQWEALGNIGFDLALGIEAHQVLDVLGV